MPLFAFAMRFLSGRIHSEKQKQEERHTERFVTKNWIGMYKICRTGYQEEEAGTHRLTLLFPEGISFLREAVSLLVRPFIRLNQDHPDFLG